MEIFRVLGEVFMPIGKVKWFDPKKGFGFIDGPEGQDVFVHYTSIQGDGFRTLKHDQFVKYELVEGDKGFLAKDVYLQDEHNQGKYEAHNERSIST